MVGDFKQNNQPVMRIFFTFLLIFLFCFDTDGQCLVTTTLTSPNYFTSLGPGTTIGNFHGQQIRVCEGGTVTGIAMSLGAVLSPNTLGKLELYRSSNSWTNLVWTRDGIPVPQGNWISGPNWFVIDYTIGQGTNYTLNTDEVITLRYHRINTGYAFHFNDNNPYADGMLVTGNYLPWGTGVRDWLMKVALNGASLPVDYLQEVWAQEDNGKIHLSWTTANEINNAGFDIERSHDGNNFENVGWVDGHGSESGPFNYTFTDAHPVKGRNYYRLKQNDFDGKFDYSHITHIDIKRSGNLSIFPNPVTDFINIQVEEDETFTIYDQMMKPVKKGVIPASRQISVSELLSGMYFLYLSERGEYERFVKG